MKIRALIGPGPQQNIFGEKYTNALAAYGDVKFYDEANFNNRARVLEFLSGADAIITSWGSPALDEEILSVCPDLKVVLHAAGSVLAFRQACI